MAEPRICPRPGCTCPLEAGRAYCSAACAASAEQLALESPCLCGHAACGAAPEAGGEGGS